jgi:mannose-6-phosphate isomerase-like protein (cupin superfamily)
MPGTPDTPGTPVVDEISTREPDVKSAAGSRTWSLRGRNFVVALTELAAGDPLTERHLPDEHLLLVPDDTRVTVEHDDARADVSEPSVVIVPPGTSTVRAAGPTTVVRVFTARCTEQTVRAVNHATAPDPRTAPLPAAPQGGDGGLRVHRLRDVPDEEGRLGRIFRTASLMVNWFPMQEGPRDPERLSPHAHPDFEQMSVTLTGSYVHHLRTAWTARMSEWREDLHVRVDGPSMTLVPPTVVHTTRAVGEGPHTLIDVFAPPREDFLAQGWVLNADAYRGAGS